jgi:hypothetical protein
MLPARALARLVLLAPLALAACTRVTALEGPPQDLHTVYTEPVMQAPQIQRVWVPDQRNSHGDLVSGHWVYLLLERGQWLLETLPPTDPPTVQVPLASPAGLPPGVARPAAGSRATPARRAQSPQGRPATPPPPPAEPRP